MQLTDLLERFRRSEESKLVIRLWNGGKEVYTGDLSEMLAQARQERDEKRDTGVASIAVFNPANERVLYKNFPYTGLRE